MQSGRGYWSSGARLHWSSGVTQNGDIHWNLRHLVLLIAHPHITQGSPRTGALCGATTFCYTVTEATSAPPTKHAERQVRISLLGGGDWNVTLRRRARTGWGWGG